MKPRFIAFDFMSKHRGRFSANLFSLQLQLKTLLEEAGGDELSALLDSLCSLSPSEQKVVIKVFSRMINKIVSGEDRLVTEGDLAVKRFEDSLYEDLVGEMKRAVLALPNSNEALNRPKLEIVGAEKKDATGEVISLDTIRRGRRGSQDPIIN